MKIKFKLGEIVYLKTDEEQLKRIVTCIQLAGGSMDDKVISYELSQGDTFSEHYDSEITKSVNELARLGV
jgi:hypothetical protein